MHTENIRKVQLSETQMVFVELTPIEGETVPEGQVRVTTRTLWATSCFGQIEESGFIDEKRLQELTPKERKRILPQILQIEERANRLSQMWYDTYKIQGETK